MAPGLAPVIVERIGAVLAEIQAGENLAVLLAEQNATWTFAPRRGAGGPDLVLAPAVADARRRGDVR